MMSNEDEGYFLIVLLELDSNNMPPMLYHFFILVSLKVQDNFLNLRELDGPEERNGGRDKLYKESICRLIQQSKTVNDQIVLNNL